MSKLSPRDIKKYLSDASLFVERGQLQDAEFALKKILYDFPNHPDALSNLATLHFMQNNIEEAIKCTKKSLEINPYQAGALNNCALGLKTLGSLDEALIMGKEAIRIQPNNLDTYLTTSLILSEMDKDAEALFYLDEALKIPNKNIDPTTLAMIYNNRANILVKRKQFLFALDDLNKSLVIKPNLLEALRNKAFALKETMNYQEALECLDQIIKLNGNLMAETYHLKGLIYDRLSQYKLSIEMYDNSLNVNPNLFQARHSKGHALLRINNFIDGWEHYEYRLFETNHELFKKNLEIDSWAVINKEDHVLLLKEQGIGDHIFFGGLLDELRSKCTSLTVELDKRLISLFERSFNKIIFIEKQSQIEHVSFNKVIPLASIAKFFRKSLSDFKKTESNYLKVDQSKFESLKNNIQFKYPIKVGVSWKTKGVDTGDIRSINFEQFIKIFESKNISIINLQYGNIENDIALIDGSENYEFINYHEIDNYKDIDGLACLIEICDIVITVDNITAHLAGALGKKTWILLPTYSDFRWMEKTSECVWYKNVRLFRQESMGNWDFVTSNIKKMLEDFINNEFLQ